MKSVLRRLLFAVTGMASLVLQSPLCMANSEMRGWKLSSGDTFQAEIETIDEERHTVTLRLDNGTETTYNTTDFCTLDQAWLLEWIETAEELESKVSHLGGKLEHFQAKGATTVTDFYVYHPSGTAPEGTARPIMVLFDPSGKGRRYLLRHIEAGEAAKITLVACDVFRNMMQDDDVVRFKEMFSIIQTSIPHDPAKIFLGGTSGGGARAFKYSALPDIAPWAGIYSNGGWLGGMKNWDRPFRSGMRVAMVNGNNDSAAAAWVDSESAVLRKRNIVISLHAFEGGHQIPPPSVQTKAFQWLLGDLQ
jgi:hypothetical protein